MRRMDSAEAAFEHAVISYFELAGSESLTSHSAEKLLVAVGCPPEQVAAAELEASAAPDWTERRS